MLLPLLVLFDVSVSVVEFTSSPCSSISVVHRSLFFFDTGLLSVNVLVRLRSGLVGRTADPSACNGSGNSTIGPLPPTKCCK